MPSLNDTDLSKEQRAILQHMCVNQGRYFTDSGDPDLAVLADGGFVDGPHTVGWAKGEHFLLTAKGRRP